MSHSIINCLEIINIDHEQIAFAVFVLHKLTNLRFCGFTVESSGQTIYRSFFQQILFLGHFILHIRNLAKEYLGSTKTSAYQSAHPANPAIVAILILKADYEIVNLIFLISDSGKKILYLLYIIRMYHCKISVILKWTYLANFLQSKQGGYIRSKYQCLIQTVVFKKYRVGKLRQNIVSRLPFHCTLLLFHIQTANQNDYN